MLNKITAAILILLITPMTYAHLDAGEDVVVGNYLIDFGYAPANPSTDDKVTIAFNLLNATTKEAITPENVWVRISSEEYVLLAGTFYPEAGNVLFTYKFPKQDVYEVSVKFRDDAGTLAENNFELFIEKGQETPEKIDPRVLFYVIAIAVLVFIVIKSELFNLPKIGKKP